MTIVRDNFSQLLDEDRLAWATGASSVLWNEYDQIPDEHTAHYRVLQADRRFIQTLSMGGFPTFQLKPEGGRVNYTQPTQGFRKTYSFDTFASGYTTSKELMDDQEHDQVAEMARDFGRAAKETMQILAATVYNRAFDTTYLGPDAKPLIATDHPLITGGVQSNSMGAGVGLSYTAIQNALIMYRRMKDHSGRRVNIRPRDLVIPPELEFLAKKLLSGTEDPTTAERATNVINGMLKPVVYNRLTSAASWFVRADPSQTQIRFYTRKPMEMMHEVETDTLGGMKHVGGFRIGYGWSDFYGIVGSIGS